VGVPGPSPGTFSHHTPKPGNGGRSRREHVGGRLFDDGSRGDRLFDDGSRSILRSNLGRFVRVPQPVTTGATGLDTLSVKELVRRLHADALPLQVVLGELTERLCDVALESRQVDAIKRVMDAIHLSASLTHESHASSHSDIVDPVDGRASECDALSQDFGDLDGYSDVMHGDDVGFRPVYPANHVILKSLGNVTGKLVWDGNKIRFRVWKKRFVPAISNVADCFKAMAMGEHVGLSDSEYARLNSLLFDITVKAVPDSVMLDLEREALSDGVAAWSYLIEVYDSMTEDELDTLALVISRPPKCKDVGCVLAQIGILHDARSILESFGRVQHHSAMRNAFLAILPDSMQLDATIWKIGPSIDNPGEMLSAHEIEMLIRSKVNPLQGALTLVGSTNEAVRDERSFALRSEANVTCYGCGSLGHFKHECDRSSVVRLRQVPQDWASHESV
jgi:hypothetical protein